MWIAGGIGVTPFLSYLRQKRKASSGGQDIFLLLFLKEEHDNVFINEMSNITGLTVVIHIDTRDGSPDLKNVLPEDWKDRNIIISGPSIMVREFKSELYSIGASKIQSEEFDF